MRRRRRKRQPRQGDKFVITRFLWWPKCCHVALPFGDGKYRRYYWEAHKQWRWLETATWLRACEGGVPVPCSRPAYWEDECWLASTATLASLVVKEKE